MAIITTKNFSNPPSVRGIDYAGQPIPDNGFYNGRPEHQNPERQASQKAPPSPVKALPARRKRRRGVMSPEMRQAFAQRMRDYWAKKRNSDPGRTESSNPVTPDAPMLGESG